MSAQSSSRRGDKDGVPGTWHTVERRGGPGGYPYTEVYFVPDNAPGPDPRHQTGPVDPHDMPGSQKVG